VAGTTTEPLTSNDISNGNDSGAITGVSIVPGSSSLTDTAFQPNPVQVSMGDTVTWTNNDTQPHAVVLGPMTTTKCDQ
jgi:plastocyanin